MNRNKSLISGLSLSASALVALISYEGYTSKAIVPTQNDRPTVGFGTTYHPDGTPVKMGDTIAPVEEVRAAYSHIEKTEDQFKESLPGVSLHQAEYDVYIDFIYQYGIYNWHTSTIRKRLLSGDHTGACNALLMWRYAGGYDCSTTINGQPNKRCWGVWKRQLERHEKCLAAQ